MHARVGAPSIASWGTLPPSTLAFLLRSQAIFLNTLCFIFIVYVENLHFTAVLTLRTVHTRVGAPSIASWSGLPRFEAFILLRFCRLLFLPINPNEFSTFSKDRSFHCDFYACGRCTPFYGNGAPSTLALLLRAQAIFWIHDFSFSLAVLRILLGLR